MTISLKGFSAPEFAATVIRRDLHSNHGFKNFACKDNKKKKVGGTKGALNSPL
jgi:hypothetical protein